MKYHPTNYRKNLELYWRQFYLNWQIPDGYHVHHIKPQGTFEDKDDTRIHHPRNLIALHPDDHVTIHKCRGDTRVNNGLFEYIRIKDRKLTEKHKKNISSGNRGKKKSPRSVEHSANLSRSLKGKKLAPEYLYLRRRSYIEQGREPPSTETRQQMSDSNKGKKRSMATRSNISKAKQQLRWFNNGVKSKMCIPGQEPAGFTAGRGLSK